MKTEAFVALLLLFSSLLSPDGIYGLEYPDRLKGEKRKKTSLKTPGDTL